MGHPVYIFIYVFAYIYTYAVWMYARARVYYIYIHGATFLLSNIVRVKNNSGQEQPQSFEKYIFRGLMCFTIIIKWVC